MTSVGVGFRTLPGAVEYFRDKVTLPTRTWRDLVRGMHARAFVIAGGMRDDFLADMRDAVERAIADGESIEKFRGRFDEIVARYGWTYNGGRNWRTRVIFETNIRTAYMAGKYAQLVDADVLARHPFWQYDHNTIVNPREEHKAWDGLILAWNDPWWDVHFPPNGWGCKCDVLPVSHRRMRELGKAGPDVAPGDDTIVPPEWRYNVGTAAWGAPIADDVMAAYRLVQPGAHRPLTPGTFVDAERPAAVRVDTDDAPEDLARAIASRRALDAGDRRAAIERALGGRERTLTLAGNTPAFRYPVHLVADTLAEQLDAQHVADLWLLEDLVRDPFEAWLAFERHPSGRVELRMRLVRVVDVAERGRLMTIATVRRGFLESFEVRPFDAQRMQELRRGQLVYGPP